jgi:LPXTG-site transpeptidase (sortase) family protein
MAPTPGSRQYLDFAQPKSKQVFRLQAAVKPKIASGPTKQVSATALLVSQDTSSAFKKVNKLLKSPRILFYKWGLPAMAVVLFIAGSIITIQTFRINKAVEAQIGIGSQENNNNEDTGQPSEVEPSPDQMIAHQVEPTAPRYVRIGEIGVFSQVYALGVDAQGDLLAPSNIYNTGWYDQSARPGENGAVLLDGHYSGIRGLAVFRNLKNLQPGSRIEIERGDGHKFGYRVVSVKSFGKDDLDMKQAVVSAKPGVNGLNIITCDGHFNRATNMFDNRLLVRAVQE